MAAETKRAKAVTRYGTRYGRTIRERIAGVEQGYKGKHKCPYCSYVRVTRTAAGIWECGKCNVKFTSRAYQLKAAPVLKSTVTEEENV